MHPGPAGDARAMLEAVRLVVVDAVRDALAIVMPVECAGCGERDRPLCSACLAQLHPEPAPRRLSDGTAVFAALRYEGVVRRAVLALKEHGRTDVAADLSVPLAAAIDCALERSGGSAATRAEAPPWVVPVPTSRAAYRRRGYDPVRLLGSRAGIRLTRALAPARVTGVQKGLSIGDRASNRRGSMIARMPCRGIRVVIVDDVVTTGATLDEAVRALAEAGAIVVGAAVLASTPRLFDSPGTHSQLGGDNDC